MRQTGSRSAACFLRADVNADGGDANRFSIKGEAETSRQTGPAWKCHSHLGRRRPRRTSNAARAAHGQGTAPSNQGVKK